MGSNPPAYHQVIGQLVSTPTVFAINRAGELSALFGSPRADADGSSIALGILRGTSAREGAR